MGWLQQFDLEGFRAIHIGLHRDWLDPVFWLFSTTGLGWLQVCLTLLAPLAFSQAKRPSLLETAKARLRDPHFFVEPLLFVIVVCGIVLPQIPKQLINRERPSNLPWALPQEDFRWYSFPSGHTTTSFGVAFLILFATWRSDYAWIGKLSLVWASLVGLSRIYRGVHWPTDVLGGIFAGLLSACAAAYLFKVSARASAGNPGSGKPAGAASSGS